MISSSRQKLWNLKFGNDEKLFPNLDYGDEWLFATKKRFLFLRHLKNISSMQKLVL